MGQVRQVWTYVTKSIMIIPASVAMLNTPIVL